MIESGAVALDEARNSGEADGQLLHLLVAGRTQTPSHT